MRENDGSDVPFSPTYTFMSPETVKTRFFLLREFMELLLWLRH
jgi:hypothetical protein